MQIRANVFALACCAGLLGNWTGASGCEPQRRALVVGISNYVTHRVAAVSIERPLISRISPTGASLRTPSMFSDLPASVNDASDFASLLKEYEFPEKNVELLKNEKATAQNILDTFQKKLIDESVCPGDVSVFYYSGHGSQIRNLAKEKTTDPYDQTLVAYDSVNGVADVRSKELVRLYKKAIDKGIYLTIILDSCQSGGLSRGATDFARVRAIGDDPRVVNDPGLVDTEGHPLDLSLKKNTGGHPAMLFLSAASYNEAAKEHGEHGDFTGVLLDKMQAHAEKAAVADVFADVRATVASLGNDQHPQIAGEGRLDKDLFGEPADSMSGLIVRSTQTVQGDSTLKLDKGRAAGLYEGCELVGATLETAKVRVKITEAAAADSKAEVLEDGGVPLPVASRFRLDKWVAPRKNALHFYLAQGAPSDLELMQAVGVTEKLSAAGVQILSDPTSDVASSPLAQIWWVGDSWRLISDRAGKGRDLGRRLDAETVLKKMEPGGRLFVNFPLNAEWAKKVVPGSDGSTQGINEYQVDDQNFAPSYILAGRWNAENKTFEYAWVRPGVVGKDQTGTGLPVRTDWFPTESKIDEELRAKVRQLDRINGWLTLSGPPGSDSASFFPYRLEIRNLTSNEVLKEGESQTFPGDKFRAYLKAGGANLAQQAKTEAIRSHWIYLLSVDCAGRVGVLFPANGQNAGNYLPGKDAPAPAEIPLNDSDFKVGDPLGVDTYILIVSDEPIDARVLPSAGVITQGQKRGFNNPLEDLLGNTGLRRGSESMKVPTTWSVQKLTFKSRDRN